VGGITRKNPQARRSISFRHHIDNSAAQKILLKPYDNERSRYSLGLLAPSLALRNLDLLEEWSHGLKNKNVFGKIDILGGEKKMKGHPSDWVTNKPTKASSFN